MRSDPPAVPAPAVPMTVHPLVWAIQLWVVASLVSLLLSVGLSRALRGAYVGAESWITHVDHSAALTSQVAAICTTLLLVYMGMLSARTSKSLVLGLCGAVAGVLPTMLVFYAHRLHMPQSYTWIATLSSALALLLCAHQSRTNTPLRVIIALGGLTLLAATLRSGGLYGNGGPLLSELGEALQSLFAWCTLLTATFVHLWTPRRKPLRAALLFGATVLLAATASAAARESIPRWILLTGRSLQELSSSGVTAPGSELAFSGALVLMVSTLLSRPGSLTQLISAIFALCCFSPTSPLVIGWMTLCGYIAVVSSFAPETGLKSSSHGVRS